MNNKPRTYSTVVEKRNSPSLMPPANLDRSRIRIWGNLSKYKISTSKKVPKVHSHHYFLGILSSTKHQKTSTSISVVRHYDKPKHNNMNMRCELFMQDSCVAHSKQGNNMEIVDINYILGKLSSYIIHKVFQVKRSACTLSSRSSPTAPYRSNSTQR